MIFPIDFEKLIENLEWKTLGEKDNIPAGSVIRTEENIEGIRYYEIVGSVNDMLGICDHCRYERDMYTEIAIFVTDVPENPASSMKY